MGDVAGEPAAAMTALDAKRAEVAERVRVARAEKVAAAKAEAKAKKEAAKAAQVQVLYKDHGVFFEDEKAAIEQYVRSHTGRGRGDTCSCPHAGTSHQISMQSLRPAKNFTRWRKVQARVAASRRASEGGDDDEDVVLTSP